MEQVIQNAQIVTRFQQALHARFNVWLHPDTFAIGALTQIVDRHRDLTEPERQTVVWLNRLKIEVHLHDAILIG